MTNSKTATEDRSSPTPFLTFLRRVSFVEGLSTLILFGIAMPLKYAAGMPMAVRIVGSVHGLLFVTLAILLFIAVDRVPIAKRIAILGVCAAIVPFGPFWFDRFLVTKN